MIDEMFIHPSETASGNTEHTDGASGSNTNFQIPLDHNEILETCWPPACPFTS